MAIGEIITCFTTEEVVRKALELKRKGISTEFGSNHTLRVVEIASQE